MKKLASLFLALTLSLGLCVPALAAEFTDIPADHAFYDAIMDCAGKGIVGGYDDGTFRPANTVTKSNFAIMLSRAFYANNIARHNDSYNLEVYGPFAGNYLAAYYNGAFEGASFYEDFVMLRLDVMNTGISRYDMAQLMATILKNKGFTVSASEKTAAQARIVDYSTIPDQYKDAVATVYALGIIGGFSNGTFGGSGTMTRGQAAVVIYRLAQYVGDGSGTGPETSIDDDLTNTPENPAGPESSSPAPETPADRTLSNGKAITEENITEILDQLKAKYPNGTSFANGYAGMGTGRSPYNNCITRVTNQYGFTTSHNQHVSTTTGCGGCAAFVADEIFGQTGLTWKKTTMADVRPGDLLITLDNEGYLTHVSICAGYVDGYEPTRRIKVVDAGGRDGPSGYKIGWNLAATSATPYDVYTAYPD